MDINQINYRTGSYKSINDSRFYSSINDKKEFYDTKISNRQKDIYCLEPQQRFLSNFINPLTKYNSILIYHSVGVGKTLSAISIAENFKDQYKIVVLTKNNNIESNFRKEITGICSNYFISEDERKIYNNTSHEEHSTIKSQVDKKINNYYSFSSYGSIKNNSNFNNSVVIIDEVHNVTGNEYYDFIINALRNSSRTKIVLLSATPVFDNIKEIFEIANLLGGNLPIRGDLLKEKYIEQNNDDKKNDNRKILSNTSSFLTQKGEKTIKKNFKGKISFLIPDESLFPQRINKGSKLTKNDNSLVVYKSQLSPFQKSVYEKTFTDTNDNTLFKNSSDALTMVYPDGTFGSKGFIKNIFKKGADKAFLKKENLKKYSCKLYSILDNLEKLKGTAFIYSNFVSFNGTELIANTLVANGYSSYFNNVDKPKFIIFHNQMSNYKKQKMIRLFNSKQNINGDLIKIIIGSPIISEGVSFKNIRQIHILEPFWNLSRIEQIIGRGVRLNSHSALPENKRNVEIFLHTAIPSIEEQNNSLDYLKYFMSEKKDREIKKLERILQTLAVDCELNKSRNLVKSSSKNGSRECQYTTCNYKCIGSDTTGKKDLSTYHIEKHDKDLYKFILKHIKKLFSIGFVYDLDSIERYIKQSTSSKNIHKENIYYVLSKMIIDQIEITDPLNQKSYLINLGNYYIIEKNDDSDQFFDRIYSSSKTIKDLNEALSIKRSESPKKIKTTKNIQKISLAPIQGSFLNKNGVYDGKFRIIDNRVVTEDNRSVSSGKVCSTFKKKDLEDLAFYLDINIEKNMSKDLFCSTILEKLKTMGRII